MAIKYEENINPLLQRQQPARGWPRETTLCRWFDAGNNGEPEYIYEDGSPAPLHHVVKFNWEGLHIPKDKRAHPNPDFVQWRAGWYPLERPVDIADG